jgi:hypothetical protein
LLIGATIKALTMANIPATLAAYNNLLGVHLTVTVGGIGVLVLHLALPRKVA